MRRMSWQSEARCRTYDPNLFFSPGSRSERKAKEVCSRCPVAEQCLAFAVDSRIDFGVWGGLSSRERHRLRRRRGLAAALAVGA